jgi:hypothetical protein
LGPDALKQNGRKWGALPPLALLTDRQASARKLCHRMTGKKPEEVLQSDDCCGFLSANLQS